MQLLPGPVGQWIWGREDLDFMLEFQLPYEVQDTEFFRMEESQAPGWQLQFCFHLIASTNLLEQEWRSHLHI